MTITIQKKWLPAVIIVCALTAAWILQEFDVKSTQQFAHSVGGNTTLITIEESNDFFINLFWIAASLIPLGIAFYQKTNDSASRFQIVVTSCACVVMLLFASGYAYKRYPKFLLTDSPLLVEETESHVHPPLDSKELDELENDL